jgi:xanthine dehydrogenase accessory factor
MLPIYNELLRCEENKIRGVIGTIIKTEGSTYQKAGAKCFLAEDGKMTGLLSGGCVESDLMEHASEVLRTSTCKRLFYDFRDKGDDLWGLGLGCNGSIDIFLEPFDPLNLSRQAQILKKSISRSLTQPTTIATIIEAKETPLLVGEKFVLVEQVRSESKTPFQIQQIETALSNGNSGLFTLTINGESLDVFFDFIQPDPHLIVCGAGPDAVPLATGAKQLNWKVTVIDHRETYLNKEHFPSADHLRCFPKGKEPDVRISSNTFVIIMTHHFEQDQMLLNHFLHSGAAYLGILGPKRRTYQLLDGISNDIPAERLEHLYSPVGLDIGSKTPQEIALSILSEMVMVHRGGSGRTMKAVKETSFSKYIGRKEGELAFQL